MKPAETLSPTDLVAIAASLGPRVAHFLADIPTVARSELAESFPIHLAGSIDLADVGRIRRVGKRAPFVGHWHHQIRSGGAAVLCAHSRRDGDDWDGFNVFGQGLAPLVDATIVWIDSHLPTAKKPRFLLIPEARVFALCINVDGNDSILVVSAGKRFGLVTERIYTPHRFFKTVFANPRSVPPQATKTSG